ncbi:MAG: DUF2513 domain-containing protein [Candidatus Nealsonbacteria bacterium]|nr:DUF2513 domain-containing protein [Candidatus Nealsonbacteria bacterium]
MMKRNMDLVRSILLAIEESKTGYAPRDLRIEGYTEEQIGYHIYIMKEGGLVNGTDVTTMDDNGPTAVATSMTWTGHEFLDAARESERWKEAKSLLDKVGGAALGVWQTVLTKLVLKNLGM